MDLKIININLRRPPTRMELRRARRWRIVENVVNVLLGLGSVAAAFWAGWLVGSGSITI